MQAAAMQRLGSARPAAVGRPARPAAARRTAAAAPRRQAATMGNANPNGIFAWPVKTIAEKFWPGGRREFNKFRGKVISEHSNVIGKFCSTFGAEPKLRQKLIKKAKMVGGELGFLA